MVSPDGQKSHVILNRLPSFSVAAGWSRDGKRLYLADRVDGRLILSAIDTATGKEQRIREYGADHFGTPHNRDAGLSPSRDGRRLAANSFRYRSQIWMMEGLEPPRSFWQRLLRR